MKKKEEDITLKLKRLRQIPETIEVYEAEMDKMEEKINYYLMRLPNLLHESVPQGDSEEDNEVVNLYGKKPTFDFEPKSHVDLLKELDDKEISLYETGKFIDLCKGPHVKNTAEINAFKLLSIAGAYWRGKSSNKMLTRIYGTAFKSKEDLKQFIIQRDEAEKRNHIKLGKQLDLFSFHKEGPGFPFFHPKGMVLWRELMKFWEEEHEKENYLQVRTPIILNKQLWETSGHWSHYEKNMYFTKIDNEDYAVKPMNCPGGILIYKTKLHSYRDLPLKIAELGIVHRHELSGTLNGLFRVRTFTQDDAHIYCSEEQIKDEVISIIKLIDRIYKAFNLNYHMELSTKPEKAIESNKWEVAENALKGALKQIKADYKLNPGDGAFYGPKIDFHIKDSLGRTWQCGTIQVDFSMPERFDLSYDGKDGEKHRPVMVHRAIYGSLERFLGIIIESFSGKFPLWLNPNQVIILTLTERNDKSAENIYERLKEENIRVKLDSRTETINKKVRDAQLQRYNYIVTIGDKEQENNTLAIRTREGKVKFNVKMEDFIKELKEEIKNKK